MRNILDYVAITVVVLLLIFVAIGVYSDFKSQSEYTTQFEEITIIYGDTLWAIANDYKKSGQDSRDYIYKVMQLNEMKTAEIREGQVIKIIKYCEI